MTRKTLPDRRPSCTRMVQWAGQTFPVTLGIDPMTGDVREVFADVARGGDLQWVVSDSCVIVSLALQHGIAPADLAKSLGRVPSWQGEVPASPLGAVVEAILREVKG